MENIFKVAILQLNAINNMANSLKKGIIACRKAKELGADIAVFPEMWNIGYEMPENDEDLAQELIEQMGGLEVLSIETLQRYFNFSAYGRDLAIGDYSKTSHGYIRDI